MSPHRRPRRPGPLIIEIAGVAGSGKSSLATALSDARRGWVLEGPLQMRNIHHLRHAMRGLPTLGRMTATNLSRRRPLTWKESKYLLYVTEWRRYLTTAPTADRDVVVLDQGPVYVLARFGIAAVPIVGCEPGDRWWREAAAGWSDTLDAVIVLDAPDPVLWQRITSRDRSHEALERGRSAWPGFADRYRRSFATVLDAVEGPAGPMVLRYDTSTRSTAEIETDIAERLTVMLDQGEDPSGKSVGGNGGGR